jgi:hypothetical protein
MRTLLKVLASLLAVVVFAVLVMFLLGSRLPHDHVAAVGITIDAPQGKVWSLMEDVDAQPSWRTGLKAVQPLPDDADGHRCWLEVQQGMKMPLCEVLVASPTTRIVAISDPNLSFGGSWTYTLTALTPTTTVLAITEHGTTGPALWRFLGHYVFGEDTMIRQYEKDIAKAAVTK